MTSSGVFPKWTTRLLRGAQAAGGAALRASAPGAPAEVPPERGADNLYRIPLVHVLEATTGGTRTHLRHLVLGLNPQRFQQSVICSVQRDPAFADDLRLFREHGVRVYLVPMRRSIHPLYDSLAMLGLLGVLRSSRDCILHAHSAKAGFLGRWAGRLLHLPVVLYTPHAFPFLIENSHGKSRFYLALERLAMRWATRIVCVSEGERQAALHAGIGPPQKLVTIPNGVALPALSPGARAAARCRLGIEEGTIVLGSVGHLSAQKGGQYLLRAFQQVHAHHPRTRLFLFGRGPLERQLREQSHQLGVGETVVFAGQREPMEDYYPGFDLFVSSSLWEGCPYSLLEAMSFALPVVATRVVGPTDIILGDVCGLLVPPRDHQALAAGIDRLLRHPALRYRLGQAARARVARHFQRERQLQQMETLYQDLWRSRPSRPSG